MHRQLLVLLLFPLVLIGCKDELSDEDKIRQLLDKMEADAEAGEMGDAMEPVAEDFRGPKGLDRKGLSRLLLSQTLGGAKVSVQRTNTEVTVTGGRATATCDAVLARGSGGLVPDNAGTWRVDIDLTKSDGEWMVAAARWKRVSPEELLE